MSNPTIYMIRHGEKPNDGGDGLTHKGEKRAQGLAKLFGSESTFNIGLIIAENYGDYTPSHDPAKPVKNERPWLTIEPLYDTLVKAGSKISLNTSITRDVSPTTKEFSDAIEAWKSGGGQGNVLICWEHVNLAYIAESLGVNSNPSPKYPDGEYDLIWTVDYPYDKIDSITTEGIVV